VTTASADPPGVFGPGPHRALVVGAGLIGTSIGLGLARAGWLVRFSDLQVDRENVATEAAAKISAAAGVDPAADAGDTPDFVVIAVDPQSTPNLVVQTARHYPRATVIDTASVKARPATEVESAGPLGDNIVLSHPLGGRATSGPDDARPDLFAGRVWALCRLDETSDAHAHRAEHVVRLCGAVPLWVSPLQHDEVLAVTSHLPQLVASGLAAAVADLGGTAARLSGPALTDMTRIAESPIDMWNQIVLANRAPIAAGLDHLIDSLTSVRSAIQAGDDDALSTAVTALLLRGRAGRSLISAKHAGLAPSAGEPTGPAWEWVEVTMPDVPGRLAATLLAAAEEGINVEDVRLDHAPHAAAGTVALAVAAGAAARLRAAVAGAASTVPQRVSPRAAAPAVDLVAIDGPSASGKSTVAKKLACELGWSYLDTGATYRAITLACLRKGFALDDAERITALATDLVIGGHLTPVLDAYRPTILLHSKDVGEEIRGEAVTSAVSTVSAHPQLRAVLVAWQRRIALGAQRCVLEGRDTGAVVVPDAQLKVWLTARTDVRASRRAQEAGEAAGADLQRRDAHDAGRAADPMQPAPDAVIVDTSDLDIDEIVAQLLASVRG